MVGDQIESGRLVGPMERLQGPVEEFGLDPGGNRELLQVTEQDSDTRQVMFPKELIWLQCAKQIEGRKSLETGGPI